MNLRRLSGNFGRWASPNRLGKAVRVNEVRDEKEAITD